MPRSIIPFLSLLFTTLCLGPSLAHLLELPNKIGLPRDEYLTVQQLYRGWALLGIVVVGAVLSNLAFAIVARRERRVFVPVLIALLAVIAAQVVFWTFTYPANQATNNWTILPENWLPLRRQWEFSHAAGAVLNLVASVALFVAVLTRKGLAHRDSVPSSG